MTTNLLSVIEQQQQKALKEHAAAPMDWACAECRPNSDMLKDGFQCSYHSALAAGKQALEQTQGESKPVALQWVAEMIMSDCGCSTNNERLLERVIGRIEHYERSNAPAHPQATEPAPSTAGEREAWLIEVKSLGPSWICSIFREHGFTRDANKAIQFPTKESAEAVLAHLWKAGRNGTVFGLDSSCYSVTEHIFLGATPPSHDAGKLVESLDSIRRYGLDTLSGRTDGPDDRDWQRQAVNEMTKRATAALLQSTDHIAEPRKMVAALPVGELTDAINAYGRACRRDGSPAWESEEGQALRAILAAARTQPVREPLPIERLREIERNQVYNNTATLIDFARAIEAAHGITKKGAP